MYRSMGRIHAEIAHGLHRLREEERGQGTIEYVALIALMVTIMGVIASSGAGLNADEIPKAISKKIKGAIDSVTASGAGSGAANTGGK